MRKIKGRCLCGSVEYSIADNLIYAGYCHCSQCRRWTGAPFSASGGVTESDFEVLNGADKLICYKKGEGSLSHFCGSCSSLVYGEVHSYNMIYVMLGTLDESPSLKPQWHVYTNYKVDWYEIADDLPQYEEKLAPY